MNTLTQTQSDNITLYYREGSSDKVYQAAIEPAGDGRFAVTFAYGRRGSTLSTGSKTSSPVGYDDAKRIFDKLVREKMAKGYTPGADGTPYVGSNGDKQPSGYLPQLLNPIDEAEVQRLLQDNVHVAQEKFDGRRLLLRKEGAAIDGINRKGLLVGLPEPVFQAFRLMPGDCVLDGESIGDVFHVFDLLMLDGQDIRARKYKNRQIALINLLASRAAAGDPLHGDGLHGGTKDPDARHPASRREGRHRVQAIGRTLHARSSELGRAATETQVLRNAVGGGVQDQRPAQCRDSPVRQGRLASGGQRHDPTESSHPGHRRSGRGPLPLCDGRRHPVSADVSWRAFRRGAARMRPLATQVQAGRGGGGSGVSVPKVRLLNRKNVREFALEMAKHRAHRFTRVSGDFFLKCEGQLKAFIRSEVQRHPSVGRTIK